MTDPIPEAKQEQLPDLPKTTGNIISAAIAIRHDKIRILEKRLHNLRFNNSAYSKSEALVLLENLEDLEGETADLQASLSAFKVAVQVNVAGTKMSLEQAEKTYSMQWDMKWRLDHMLDSNGRVLENEYVVLDDKELGKRLEGISDNMQTLKNIIDQALNSQATFNRLPSDVAL